MERCVACRRHRVHAARKAAPASCVGLEFVGHGAANVVNGVVSSLPSAPASAPLTAEGDSAAAAIRFFFVETEEQTGHALR